MMMQHFKLCTTENSSNSFNISLTDRNTKINIYIIFKSLNIYINIAVKKQTSICEALFARKDSGWVTESERERKGNNEEERIRDCHAASQLREAGETRDDKPPQLFWSKVQTSRLVLD